jgi:hypothetical protein
MGRVVRSVDWRKNCSGTANRNDPSRTSNAILGLMFLYFELDLLTANNSRGARLHHCDEVQGVIIVHGRLLFMKKSQSLKYHDAAQLC